MNANRIASETCRVIINQVKQKLHLVGYLLIQMWEVVHLVDFYYKNISRCTVLWMSNSWFKCVSFFRGGIIFRIQFMCTLLFKYSQFQFLHDLLHLLIITSSCFPSFYINLGFVLIIILELHKIWPPGLQTEKPECFAPNICTCNKITFHLTSFSHWKEWGFWNDENLDLEWMQLVC